MVSGETGSQKADWTARTVPIRPLVEQCPGTLVRGMVTVIESDRRDDLRLRDDVNNGASLAGRGRQRLLDVHVLAGARGCDGNRHGIDWAR